MAKLNEGAIVTMSDVAMETYDNTKRDPHGLNGTLLATRKDEYCYLVMWDNDAINDYREVDLIAAPSAA